jgi:hypothetical protein
MRAGSRSSSSSRVSAAEAAACVAAPLGSSPGTSSGFGYELLRFMQNTVQKVRRLFCLLQPCAIALAATYFELCQLRTAMAHLEALLCCDVGRCLAVGQGGLVLLFFFALLYTCKAHELVARQQPGTICGFVPAEAGSDTSCYNLPRDSHRWQLYWQGDTPLPWPAAEACCYHGVSASRDNLGTRCYTTKWHLHPADVTSVLLCSAVNSLAAAAVDLAATVQPAHRCCITSRACHAPHASSVVSTHTDLRGCGRGCMGRTAVSCWR